MYNTSIYFIFQFIVQIYGALKQCYVYMSHFSYQTTYPGDHSLKRFIECLVSVGLRNTTVNKTEKVSALMEFKFK